MDELCCMFYPFVAIAVAIFALRAQLI